MFKDNLKYIQCEVCGFWYNPDTGHVCTNVIHNNIDEKLDKILKKLGELDTLLKRLVNRNENS